MSDKTIPAISVIIPMYNVEKYIGECLDSLQAQAFKDFEVIVVDDCSTDNSCKIVENYIKADTFRIKLIRSKVNSGGAGIPRNIGLRNSFGEYLFFMDSDDVILPEAFETLYKIAEKFKADVVHADNCYEAPNDTVSTDRNVIKERVRVSEIISEPTPISGNFSLRIKKFVQYNFRWEPWNHLIRRDLLMTNDIKFSSLRVADDAFFTIQVLCLANKIVLIPDSFYVWRNRADSNCREQLPVEKKIHRRAGDIMRGIGLIDEFVSKIDFFKQNPEYRYALLDFWAICGGNVLDLYAKFPAYQLDPLVRREIEQIENKDALSAFLFNRMNVFNVRLIQQQQQIQQLKAQLQQAQNPFQFNGNDIFRL